MTKTSSARRLREIIEKSIADGELGQKAGTVWVSQVVLLSLNPETELSDPGGLIHLMKVWQLILQVKNDIALIHGNEDGLPHLKPLSIIEQVMAPGMLNTNWDASKGFLVKNRVIDLLDFLVFELEQNSAEILIDQGTINEVLESICSNVKSLTEDNDLDSDLRIFLVDQLDQVRVAIQDYKIHGIDAIRIRLNQAIGAVVTSGVVADGGGSSNLSVAGTVDVLVEVAGVVEKSNRFIGGANKFLMTLKSLLPAGS